MRVEGATEAVLLLSAASSFNGYDKSPSREGVDPEIRTGRDLAAAARRDFADLRGRHVRDYTALFNRVSLDLGHNGAWHACCVSSSWACSC